MTLGRMIADGLKRLANRIEQLVTRLRGLDSRVSRLERFHPELSTEDPDAQPTVPGSPIGQIGENFVVKIGDEDTPGSKIYQTTIQRPTGLGSFENDPDRTEVIKVASYPNSGTGKDPGDRLALAKDSYQVVRWDGRDNSGNVNYYHCSIAPSIQQLRGKTVGDDHLVCRSWDGTTEGDTDILVAKPYLLRRTPFDGKTLPYGAYILKYTYQSAIKRKVEKSNDPAQYEYQYITPNYQGAGGGYDGDLIYAAVGFAGGVGVTVNGVVVQYLDMNVDGRVWATI